MTVALQLGKMYMRCSMLETWLKACNEDEAANDAIEEFLRSTFKVTHGADYKPTDADLFVPSIPNMEVKFGILGIYEDLLKLLR